MEERRSLQIHSDPLPRRARVTIVFVFALRSFDETEKATMLAHRVFALCLSFGVATATMTSQVGAATIFLNTPASNTIYAPGEQIKYRGEGGWNTVSEAITYDVDVELRWGEGVDLNEYVIVRSDSAIIDYNVDAGGNKNGEYSFKWSTDLSGDSNLKATQYNLPDVGLQVEGYVLIAIPYRKHGPYNYLGGDGQLYRVHSDPLPIRIQ